MVVVGHEAGFGDEQQLTRTFTEFQQQGLLGKSIAKAPRRGGEGLWHPMQQVLWLDLLQRRVSDQVRSTTLANVPVGLWLLGQAGIETSQAQRAFEYWSGYLTIRDSGEPRKKAARRPKGTAEVWSTQRPTGSRSLQRRALVERVEALSAPGAPEEAKRQLRLLLEILNSGAGVSPDLYISRVLDVLAPGRDPTPAQRHMASMMSRGLAIQKLAVDEASRLVVPAAIPLWEWARRAYQADLPEFELWRQQAAGDASIGHLFRRSTFEVAIQEACNSMLTTLGIGIALLRGELGMRPPPGEELPPPLPGLHRHPG